MDAACYLIMEVFEVCMNEVWHARNGIVVRGRTWSNPVPAPRIWPQVRGSGWNRCLTRAHRKGGSARWWLSLGLEGIELPFGLGSGVGSGVGHLGVPSRGLRTSW